MWDGGLDVLEIGDESIDQGEGVVARLVHFPGVLGETYLGDGVSGPHEPSVTFATETLFRGNRAERFIPRTELA